MNAQQLEQLLHQEIPITKALAIKVQHLELQNIIIVAPFDENKNIHNTAFAGSIFTTATLAGWSLLSNLLDENQLSGAVVLAKGDIQYLKPINSDILAYCELPEPEKVEKFLSQFKRKGRARLDLSIKVREESVREDEQDKAILAGNFAVIKE